MSARHVYGAEGTLCRQMTSQCSIYICSNFDISQSLESRQPSTRSWQNLGNGWLISAVSSW